MLSLVLLGLLWNIFADPVDQFLVRGRDCPDIAAAAILSMFFIDVASVPVDSFSFSDSDRILLFLLLFSKRSTGLRPVGSFPSFSGRSPPCDFPGSCAALASRACGAGGMVIAGCLGRLAGAGRPNHGSHTSSPSILRSQRPP